MSQYKVMADIPTVWLLPLGVLHLFEPYVIAVCGLKCEAFMDQFTIVPVLLEELEQSFTNWNEYEGRRVE